MKKLIFLSTLLLFLLLPIRAKTPVHGLNIIFIGNSITQGAGLQQPATQSPPVRMVKYLTDRKYDVKFINCGVSGSTTLDFLPASVNLFHKVIVAADSLAKNGWPLFFSVSLGTNDSAIKGTHGAPVSPDNYKKNLLIIIDSLLTRYPGCHILLHQPIWYSPNTHNGAMYLAEGLERLQTYTPEILSITHLRKGKVLIGDRKAYDFFKRNYLVFLNPENGNSGTFYLHPNALGAEKLGDFWGKAFINQLKKTGY